MIIEDETQEGPLKQHLITILEPICDADPETLADYVIALLKHDIPNKDLMNLCISQLEEFLKGETEGFVNQLFKIIETKSYLPGRSEKNAEEKSSELKRSRNDIQEQKEDSDQSDDDRNFKHKRTTKDSRSSSLSVKSSEFEDQSQPPNKKYRTDNKLNNKYSNNNQNDNRHQNNRNSFSRNNSHDNNSNNDNKLGKRRRNDNDNEKGNGKYMRNNDSNDHKNIYHQNQQSQINNNTNKHINAQKSYQNMNQEFNYMNNNMNNNGNNPNIWFNQNNPNMQMMQNNQNRFRGRNPQQFRNNTNNGMHPRQRCIDYDEKGYCLRGDMCPFDHGMDRIVVNEMASSNRRNFDNMMNNNIAQRMMPSMNQNNFNNQFMNGNNSFENDNSYLNTEGYDPEQPSYNSNVATSQWGNDQTDNSFQNSNVQNDDQIQSNQSNNESVKASNNPQNISTNTRGRGGRGRGRGRGAFGFNRHRQSVKQPILNIENIPPEYFAIDKINNYFKKFGTIININLNPRHYKATIQFSQYNEANQAYNSPDPIFGNRFVKLYWAKTESEENENSSQNEESATNVNSNTNPNVSPKSKPIEEEKQSTPALSSEEMEQINIMKKSMISRQLEKQKAFMKQVENPNLTKPEKDEILNNIRLITESVKHIMNASPQNIKVLAGNILQQPKETDIAKSTDDKSSESTKLSAEEQLLKEKVESLKAEAATLGIDTSTITSISAPTASTIPTIRGRGGFRARGRGIHGWARGGRSFKLDNRPTRILIKGFSKEHQLQIKQHFELYGIVESFLLSKDGNSAIVHYQTRREAEQAYTYGKKIDGINDTLELSWFTETPDPKLYEIPATAPAIPGASSAVAEALAQLANKINKINNPDNKAVANLSSTLESLSRAENKTTNDDVSESNTTEEKNNENSI